MKLYRFAWVLWVAGTVLVLLSWVGVVSPAVGWTGTAIALAGFGISAVPQQAAHAARPDQRPVEPSGVEVGPEARLDAGSRVLAYSRGYWWRAYVVAVEDDEMVRVGFPGFDPSLQDRVPRSYLQVDPRSAAPPDEGTGHGEPHG